LRVCHDVPEGIATISEITFGNQNCTQPEAERKRRLGLQINYFVAAPAREASIGSCPKNCFGDRYGELVPTFMYKRKGTLPGAFACRKIETIILLIIELNDRRHHGVGGVLHRLLQAGDADLLHAAVSQGEVTHFVVSIDRPRPTRSRLRDRQ